MPVTFPVAKHLANQVELPPALREGLTPEEVLSRSCGPQYKTADEVLQSSFADVAPPSETLTAGPGRAFTSKIPNLIPSRNGFVDTVISAYNKHHALVIRPDDVWICILTQFNYFVNANAELLRANFVAHEGKEKLTVTAEGTRYSLDFGAMSREMVEQLERSLVDPSLRAWVLPDFSTTTVTDTTVSAIVMMATLKAFFEYEFCGIECGIPRVTLLGERSDYENILGRLEKLKEYGLETIAWYHLLRPVIARFVAAFDAPESTANVDFWQKVAHYENMGSGPMYYSGWITAFCVFDSKGKWVGNRLRDTPLPPTATSPVVTAPRSSSSNLFNKFKNTITRKKSATTQQHALAQPEPQKIPEPQIPTAPELLSAAEFVASYYIDRHHERWVELRLVLDGAMFHLIDSADMPPSYAEVDVKLDDNGENFECCMIAGVVAGKVSSSGDKALSETGENDTMEPVVGWWMFTKK
ncbi:hypothetical protein B0H19DRAFT_526945 [Mycena capillaripes]|nr:hypothetical protein B0H19DRAFT_526945 [Mycena capillaripes]